MAVIGLSAYAAYRGKKATTWRPQFKIGRTTVLGLVLPRKFAVFRTNAGPNNCLEALFRGHRRDLFDYAAVQRLQLLSRSRRG